MPWAKESNEKSVDFPLIERKNLKKTQSVQQEKIMEIITLINCRRRLFVVCLTVI